MEVGGRRRAGKRIGRKGIKLFALLTLDDSVTTIDTSLNSVLFLLGRDGNQTNNAASSTWHILLPCSPFAMLEAIFTARQVGIAGPCLTMVNTSECLATFSDSLKFTKPYAAFCLLSLFEKFSCSDWPRVVALLQQEGCLAPWSAEWFSIILPCTPCSFTI